MDDANAPAPKTKRLRLSLTAVTLTVLAWPGPTAACNAIAVTKTAVGYPHATTIQAAVDGAQPCDWILIAPGVYREAVTIRTPDLHLRGLDRGRVVLDGGHRIGNGIHVLAGNVSIENLTVRNFDRRSLNDERHGNAVWWEGGAGNRELRRWSGRYLTVYDTGLLGGYGVYAEHAVVGRIDHVYASGFNDSGIYIGACRDCEATVSRVTAERNAVGYDSTNAGGHLLVEDSLFTGNAIGASVDSSESDWPPPQLGSCDAARNRRLLPSITSTVVSRCTIFRRDRFVANNNPAAPSNTSSVRPGFGIGIVLLGAYGDLIDDNLIARNRNIGLLALEFPFERPRRAGALRFQLAGNRFQQNTISGSALDLALEGGLYGARSSVDNCVAGNRLSSSLPADLDPFSCRHATTPNPGPAASLRILKLLARLHAELLARAPRGQPAPGPQPTMPAPCRGLPTTSLCRR